MLPNSHGNRTVVSAQTYSSGSEEDDGCTSSIGCFAPLRRRAHAEEGSQCSACLAPFGIFRRRHECCKCKLQFCSSCTQKEQGGEVCDPCTMSVVMKPQQEALMAKMAQFPHHMQAAMVPVNSSIAAIAEAMQSMQADSDEEDCEDSQTDDDSTRRRSSHRAVVQGRRGHASARRQRVHCREEPESQTEHCWLEGEAASDHELEPSPAESMWSPAPAKQPKETHRQTGMFTE